MILIICAWVYYFLLILSIGAGVLKLIARLAGDAINIHYSGFYQFWFGFTVVIGMLQVISLFLPIGNITFSILSLLALIFVIINFKSALAKLNLLYRRLITPKGLISFLVIVILVLFVSYAANNDVTHTDTFIYHFNAVKWARDYPVVPGLANLHGRLGFNSSFFLFAAFTEPGIYSGQSAHIALPFLMIVCLIQWFLIISNGSELMSKRIFCMLTFPFLLIHITLKMDINSLSTDYPTAVLTLIFCIALLDALKHKMVLLLSLSAVVFSFKLSGMLTIGIGIVALAGYVFLLKQGNKNSLVRKIEARVLTISFVLLCFIVSGFLVRNVIVSGWLIYPFPIGNLHLPWSVPKPYVMDMIAWIKSFPKIPGGASPTTIADNNFLYWFTPWLENFKQSNEFYLFSGTMIILLWCFFQVKSFTIFIYARLNILLLVLFALASILFWFISAPDIRFGSIYFFIFFAAAIVLLYEGNEYKNILKVFVYGLFIYQAIYQMPAYVISSEPNLFTFAYTKAPKLVRVIASPPDQKPPLYIYMPLEGNQCGDSPIPCTPYAGGLLHSHRMLRQRVPGDLSKGFLSSE